jgi:hypothetical protein
MSVEELHRAADRGDVKEMQRCLDAGINVDARNAVCTINYTTLGISHIIPTYCVGIYYICLFMFVILVWLDCITECMLLQSTRSNSISY